RLESPVSYQVGAARSGIRHLTAIREARSPRKTCAIRDSVRNLPSPDQEIGNAASVTHELLAFAYRQLVNYIPHKYLVAIERVRSPSDCLAHIKVARIVVIRV